MTTVKNIKELEKAIQQRISKALQENVSKTVKKVMKEKIEDEVYEKYPDPKLYERQKEHGGLLDEDNMEVTMLDETTLSVENIRSDNGRNVAEVVITGNGYDFDFEYNGVPRDFIGATREELRHTNEHVHSLYVGLKSQGLDVET